MRSLLTLGMVLALAALWGCDVIEREEADVTRLTLEFSSPSGAYDEGVLDGCATSIETVVLNVNGREFREVVSSNTIVFEVAGIRRGAVRAEAVVLSNTGDTLFVGEDRRTADAADFGTVDIHLEKIRPVLQICPDTLDLIADNDYVGTLSIWNRGSRTTRTVADTLIWRAVEPRVCVVESCVFLNVASDTVIVPRPYLLFVGGGPSPPETIFKIPFESRFGRAQIYARVVDPQVKG